MPLRDIKGKLIQYDNNKKKLTLYYDEAGVEERASIFIRCVDKNTKPLYYPTDFTLMGDFNYYDLYKKADDITHMLNMGR